MAKESGMGDRMYVGAYDLSGDIGSVSRINGGFVTLPGTDITMSAQARLGGERHGELAFNAYFDTAAGASHARLSTLPTTDVVMSYWHGGVIGNDAAAMVAKQVNYDGKRGADGSFTFDVSALSNGYGLDWGNQLTAGKRTDTAATNGASWDGAASTSFGWQAYLHVFAFTGTDVTMTIQDSANDSAYANLSGGAFTQVTGLTAERIAAATATATIRRYVRVITTTSGGVTSVTFAVTLTKNAAATTF